MSGGACFSLSGSRADVAMEVLDGLSRMLLEPFEDEEAFSLASGLAGDALAHAYLARLFPRREHLERAVGGLERAVAVSQSQADIGLFTGALGVAFVLEHLCNEGVLDEDDASTEALCESLLVDASLLAGVADEADVVEGMSGVLLYAAECRGRHRSEELAHVGLERLLSIARRTPDGALFWCRGPRSPSVIDVGVAHGQAGVFGALERAARVFHGGAFGSSARAAFDGLARMRRAGDGRYPALLPALDGPAVHGRNAWCYGDPGTSAVAILGGARLGLVTEDDRAVAARVAGASRDSTKIEGVGVCHGTASLAHVLRRLSALTGDERLAGASMHWFDELFDELRGPEGRGTSQSFLEGAAGVALVVAGALDPRADLWDAPLLLQITPEDSPISQRREGSSTS